MAMKKKIQLTTKKSSRPKTSPLDTEERLTALANLIIDKLMEKRGTKLLNSKN